MALFVVLVVLAVPFAVFFVCVADNFGRRVAVRVRISTAIGTVVTTATAGATTSITLIDAALGIVLVALIATITEFSIVTTLTAVLVNVVHSLLSLAWPDANCQLSNVFASSKNLTLDLTLTFINIFVTGFGHTARVSRFRTEHTTETMQRHPHVTELFRVTVPPFELAFLGETTWRAAVPREVVAAVATALTHFAGAARTVPICTASGVPVPAETNHVITASVLTVTATAGGVVIIAAGAAVPVPTVVVIITAILAVLTPATAVVVVVSLVPDVRWTPVVVTVVITAVIDITIVNELVGVSEPFVNRILGSDKVTHTFIVRGRTGSENRKSERDHLFQVRSHL